MYNYSYFGAISSGVVGRERMGTAFPHKKLSGNGVPTREILKDVFFYYCNYKLVIFTVTMLHIPCTSNYVKTGHQNSQCIRALKLIMVYQGYQTCYQIVKRRY